MRYFAIPLFLLIVQTTDAQQLQPAGGAGYKPVATECITPAHREATIKMLEYK